MLLTWLMVLLSQQLNWSWPDIALFPTASTSIQTSTVELVRAGQDAVLLIQVGAQLKEAYVLQEANGSLPVISRQNATLNAEEEVLSVNVGGNQKLCFYVAGAATDANCSQSVEGQGLIHVVFTKNVSYDRFSSLLAFYDDFESTLRHVEEEILANSSFSPGNGRRGKSCSDCGGGGLGSKSCSIESDGFSCSVSCNPGYYACCSVLGGCRCCK